jgi:PAS domain S-box-containing protein
VDINRNTAGRYLENLLVSGQVEMRRLGMAKIYVLSQRVPLSAVLSISSELVVQLDSSLRIIYANEPFLRLVGADNKTVLGKNIEYTPVAIVFDDLFPEFLKNIREGLTGKEWSGEIALSTQDIIVFCRIAPTVFEDGRKGVSIFFEDISERKKVDDALRESEERYHQLVDISPDAVIIHRQGKIIFANPAFLKQTGASHYDEIIDKNILDFIHPDFREAVRKNIEKDLIGTITPPMELPMLRIDGTQIIVEGRGVKTFIDGKPAIQVAIRDITERRHAEKALRDSEEKYRNVVDRANDAICIIQDGIIKMCNPRMAEYWGGSVEEIPGRPFTDFIHPDILFEIVDSYHRRMAGESPPSIFETILMRKDGSRSYGEVNAGIISYEGKPADLVIIRDINDRKKAEDALCESEATASALINAWTDSVILMDTRGKILALNETAAVRFGRRADELIGAMVYDLLPAEISRTRRSLIAQVIEKRDVVRFEDERNGRWYDSVVYPIMSGTGEVIRIAIIARDITDRENTKR